jgi:hypothetical protein
MSRLHFGFSVLCTSLLSLLSCASVQAQGTTTILPNNTIVTTVPAPKESIVIPEGYTGCFTVPAGWSKDNVWVAERKVCQYGGSATTTNTAVQGEAWVDSYWACTKYKTTTANQSECTSWEWRPGHWIKTFPVF